MVAADREVVAQELQNRMARVESAEKLFNRFLAEMHDEHGWTYQEIADEAGIAKSWVFKLAKKGRKR